MSLSEIIFSNSIADEQQSPKFSYIESQNTGGPIAETNQDVVFTLVSFVEIIMMPSQYCSTHHLPTFV